MLRKSACVSLSVALLIASGCGGDATGPAASGPGTFSAQVSGAVNTSFTGVAAFAITTDGFFGLQLTDGRGHLVGYIQVLRGAGRPGVGSHPIGSEEWDPFSGFLVALIHFPIADEGFATHSRESGTLTITASSTNRLTGTLEFEAAESMTGRTVTVTASFDATCERCE